MKEKTCCFTGHRILPYQCTEKYMLRLNREIENLHLLGVNTFISGGKPGFSQMAAALVAAKKQMGYSVRLVFALPCPGQDALWSSRQRGLYRELLQEADEVHHVSSAYSKECMHRQSVFMVENAAFCICALLKNPSGTAETVKLAEERGLTVINIAKDGYGKI